MYLQYKTIEKDELADQIKKIDNADHLLDLKRKVNKKYFKEILLAYLKLKGKELTSVNIMTCFEKDKDNLNDFLDASIDDIKCNLKYDYTSETLERLSNSNNYITRCDVASHRNTSNVTLEKLSNDKNWWVRSYVALSIKNFTTEILERLSSDASSSVRNCVARNPHCSPDILEKLSSDTQPIVRKGVSENKNCPVSILKRLIDNDSYNHIKDYCVKRLNEIEIHKKLTELSTSDNALIRCSVARNENCPKDVLACLSADTDQNVRRSVASNKNCPEDILEDLIYDDTPNVIGEVATNPSCPAGILTTIIETCDDHYVLFRAASNTNCSAKDLGFLSYIEDLNIQNAVAKNLNCTAEILDRFFEDSIDINPIYIINNPNCPIDLLEKIGDGNNDYLVLAAIINKPNCPKHVLEHISNRDDADAQLAIAKRKLL